MGFFDLFRKARPAPAPAAPAARRKGGDFVVPDGHKVLGYPAPVEPGVLRTQGGLVIASLGVAGDDMDRELEELLRDLEAALREPSGNAMLVAPDGPIRLSDLVAPSNPPVVASPSPVHWVFHQGSAAATAMEPRRMQALLRRIHELGALRDPPIRQTALIVDEPSPSTLQFARFLRGLGVEVRQPDGKPDKVVMEVERPDGVTLSALVGAPFPSEGNAVDSHARTVNQAKDRAGAQNDGAQRRRLEEEELDYLARCMGTAAEEATAQPPFRAPRLCRMLLDAGRKGGDETMSSLFEELLGRDTPLLLMMDPRNPRSGQLRAFGDLDALPVYPDMRCLQAAAEDLGMPSGSFVMAGLLPREVFMMAAEGNVAVAINAYRDRSSPIYVIVPNSDAASLARGVLPR